MTTDEAVNVPVVDGDASEEIGVPPEGTGHAPEDEEEEVTDTPTALNE